jgi:hypothetical protein
MSRQRTQTLPLPLREGAGAKDTDSTDLLLNASLPPTPPFKRRGRILPALPFLLLLGLLASCADPGAPPGSAQAQTKAQTAAACRQRADQVYNTQHRDTIYAPPADVNTPFSASYAPGQDQRGLTQIFERDSIMSDCVRNTGANGDRTPEAQQGPPPETQPGPPPPGSPTRP